MAPPCLNIPPHRRRDVSPCKVLRSPQDETLGRLAVSAAPAGLLVIRFERGWRPPVQYLPHIGLVDSHAERAGRDDDPRLSREKRTQHASPNARAQAGVTGCRADAGPEQCAT